MQSHKNKSHADVIQYIKSKNISDCIMLLSCLQSPFLKDLLDIKTLMFLTIVWNRHNQEGSYTFLSHLRDMPESDTSATEVNNTHLRILLECSFNSMGYYYSRGFGSISPSIEFKLIRNMNKTSMPWEIKEITPFDDMEKDKLIQSINRNNRLAIAEQMHIKTGFVEQTRIGTDLLIEHQIRFFESFIAFVMKDQFGFSIIDERMSASDKKKDDLVTTKKPIEQIIFSDSYIQADTLKGFCKIRFFEKIVISGKHLIPDDEKTFFVKNHSQKVLFQSDKIDNSFVHDEKTVSLNQRFLNSIIQTLSFIIGKDNESNPDITPRAYYAKKWFHSSSESEAGRDAYSNYKKYKKMRDEKRYAKRLFSSAVEYIDGDTFLRDSTPDEVQPNFPDYLPEPLERCRKAADLGLANAQCLMGDLYAEGDNGLRKSQLTAVDFYREAAEQKYPEAMRNLGYYYLFGEKFLRNLSEGIKLLTFAVKNNDVVAKYYLGHCYEYGVGVKKNIELSLKCYGQAADGGDEDAQDALKRYYESKENKFCKSVASPVSKDVSSVLLNLPSVAEYSLFNSPLKNESKKQDHSPRMNYFECCFIL